MRPSRGTRAARARPAPSPPRPGGASGTRARRPRRRRPPRSRAGAAAHRLRRTRARTRRRRDHGDAAEQPPGAKAQDLGPVVHLRQPDTASLRIGGRLRRRLQPVPVLIGPFCRAALIPVWWRVGARLAQSERSRRRAGASLPDGSVEPYAVQSRRGSVRAPGQGRLPALRHSGLRGAPRDDARGGARGCRGARRTVVVKAQVLTGGRGKAGGVQVAGGPDEAEEQARAILGLDIRGHVVRRVWVERAAEIAKEYYLSVTFDRGARAPLLMLTTRGGVDIEQVAAETPEALARVHVDPLEGYRPWHGAAADLRRRASRTREEQRQIAAIVERLYRCFVESDAMLCEINPLIVTASGDVVALDAKVTIDESALFRQPDLEGLRDTSAADPLEAFAREQRRHVREARRLGRDPRQRRRALDVDGRRGRGRGRPAGELLRPRRRRLGAGRGRRARGDRARRAGALDPLQHLRRHHALRRGRARDPHGARAGARSTCRSSCASTARTPTRAGACSPTRA